MTDECNEGVAPVRCGEEEPELRAKADDLLVREVWIGTKNLSS